MAPAAKRDPIRNGIGPNICAAPQGTLSPLCRPVLARDVRPDRYRREHHVPNLIPIRVPRRDTRFLALQAARLAQHVLDNDDAIFALAGDIARAREVLFLGRRGCFPIALEGALKLKGSATSMPRVMPQAR